MNIYTVVDSNNELRLGYDTYYYINGRHIISNNPLRRGSFWVTVLEV